jgi:hypothetical protein
MKQKIVTAIIKFLQWVKYLFWTKPITKPPKEQPIRVKGEQVFKDYMVLVYHGQKINIRVSEYEMWKANSRYDKRATAHKFAELEKKGVVRFELIEGKWICLKNKDYEAKAHTK